MKRNEGTNEGFSIILKALDRFKALQERKVVIKGPLNYDNVIPFPIKKVKDKEK